METDLGQGHVECGKCSTSDAAAAADGLRRKITAWTRGWLDKERGKGMGKEAARKKSVCVMNYYPLIKVHVDFFRPFQPCCSSIFSNFSNFCCKCCKEFSSL